MCLQRYQTKTEDDLQGVIHFLEMTSKWVDITNDYRPICSRSDQRLTDLRSIYMYLVEWEESASDPSQTLTREAMWDWKCSALGLVELFESQGVRIVPGRINSDVVENHFCQVRSFGGSNTNPSYDAYRTLQTSIILTQKVGSCGKTNAGGAIEPYSIALDRPLRKRVATDDWFL